MATIPDKLNRGVKILKKAGDDPDLLGSALLRLHGALEDSFRAILTANPNVPPSEKDRINDFKQVQWVELLNLMQTYQGLEDRDRSLILKMNQLRIPVGHGAPFMGNREQVVQYAAYITKLISSFNRGEIPKTTSPSPNKYANNSKYPLRTNTSTTTVPKFTIPSHLTTFKWGLFNHLLTVNVSLYHLTGKIVKIRNHNHTSDLVQEIWFKPNDAGEEYVKMAYSVSSARTGHYATFVFANIGGIRRCLAVLIHDIQLCHYDTNYWRGLLINNRVVWERLWLILLGEITFIFSTIVLVILLAPFIVFHEYITVFLTVLWLLLLILIPISIWIVHGDILAKKFRIHVAKVLGVAVGSESTDDERSVKKILLVILYILLGAIAFVGAFVGGVSDSMRRRW